MKRAKKNKKNLGAEMRELVLFTAAKAVCKGRNVSYDEPENNFVAIARLINAHLKNRFGTSAPELTAGDVAMIGMHFKQGRLGFNPEHLDSWIDIAGYAACGADVARAK